MDPIGPTSAELAVAGIAVALVVVVAGAVYVRVVTGGGSATSGSPWVRLAAAAVAAIGAGSGLVLTVLWGAAEKGSRFGAPPFVATEPFASLLVDVRTIVDISPGDRARYATVVLLPLAITAAVLAAGLVRDAGSATVRLVTGAVAGVCIAGAVAAITGEAGRLIEPLALGLGVLALTAMAGLVVDELGRDRA